MAAETKHTVQNWTARIVNASASELMLITYEMLMESLEQAVRYLQSKEEVLFDKEIKRSHKILRELTDTLDMSYAISLDLMPIYIYANKQIIHSSIIHEEGPLEEVIQILQILYKGWKDAAADVRGQPKMMGNTQQIYAGLTYGKGTLTESVTNNEKNRGYKA